MKTYNFYIVSTFILLLNCDNFVKTEKIDNSAINNFNVIWEDFKKNYPLFDHYNVDWQEVYDKYVDRIEDTMSSEGEEFNRLVSLLLLELQDYHVYIVPHSNAFESFLRNRYDKYYYDIDQVKEYIDTNFKSFNSSIFYAGKINSEYTSDRRIYYDKLEFCFR